MKANRLVAVLTSVAILFFALTDRAADITAVQSGNWSDTNVWDSGTVPGAEDTADIPADINVTVDANAVIQSIYDSGKVTMGTNATLNILTDSAIASGTTLDASAPGNTVIYSANVYFAKPQNYYNLIFGGLGGFYNGDLGHGPVGMTIAGDLTISGTASVEAGANITIDGNLTIGTTNNAAYLDCSVSTVVVKGNTTVNGFLLDNDGSLTNSTGGIETNIFMGNVTINPGGTWNVSDVTTWAFGGNFTNHGTIKSKGYGSASFNGTGNIAGNPFQIRTLTINGTYGIDTTITLTTNTPTLNGTLVFDLASTNKIIYFGGTNALYYSGNLNVVNSGAVPASGNSYQLFSGSSYGGAFSATSFPSLPSGLSWVDNLATSGSIAVTGSILGAPALSFSHAGGQLTLSWDSTTFPGYSVQAQTNSGGLGSNWNSTGSGTVSPFVITPNPANPPVFFRLSKP